MDPLWIVGIGLLFLAIGLALYVLLVIKGGTENPHARQHNVLCWFLVAFAGAVLLFGLFPGSSADGTILTFKVGGAVGGFVAIWSLGVKFAGDAAGVDEREKRVKKLEADLAAQQLQIDIAKAKDAPEDVLPPSVIRYKLSKRSDDVEIGIMTGNMLRAKDVDVWVNSENTNMQMSRYYEGTVSGMIRYYAAKRDPSGKVTTNPDGRANDPIADELSSQVTHANVEPASVFVTGPGELRTNNGVKKIFHVAAVEGRIQPRTLRGGYERIPNIEDCVRSALVKMDSAELASENLNSIVFPLLGSGHGKGEIEETARKLIAEAASYLELEQTTRIKRVYFMALTQSHLDACTLAVNGLKDTLKSVAEPSRSAPKAVRARRGVTST